MEQLIIGRTDIGPKKVNLIGICV